MAYLQTRTVDAMSRAVSMIRGLRVVSTGSVKTQGTVRVPTLIKVTEHLCSDRNRGEIRNTAEVTTEPETAIS